MGKMTLYSGKQVDPLNMKVDDICIEDIAHSLSNVCRFNGHTSEFYSVAQHSVYVSVYVSRKNAMWGLLHDATEAYLCDVVRPLKMLEEFSFYRLAETALLGVIAERFGLSGSFPQEVQKVDNMFIASEARDLGVEIDFSEYPDQYERMIIPQPPQNAKRCFLDWFDVVQNY